MKRFSRNVVVGMLGLCLVGLLTETASARWIIQYRNGRRVRIWIPDGTGITGQHRQKLFSGTQSSSPAPAKPESAKVDNSTGFNSNGIILRRYSSSITTTSEAATPSTSFKPWSKMKP